MTIEIEEIYGHRNTGRTKYLLGRASQAASFGQSVLYVAPNLPSAELAKQKVLDADMLPEDGGGMVQVESISTMENQRGRDFDLVLLDDADWYEEKIPYIIPLARQRVIVMRDMRSDP